MTKIYELDNWNIWAFLKYFLSLKLTLKSCTTKKASKVLQFSSFLDSFKLVQRAFHHGGFWD